MAKKQKKNDQDALLEGLDFLQDLAYAQEEADYARRHTDFQALAQQVEQIPSLEGGEERPVVDVDLREVPETVAAGSGKFGSHFKATAFGRNTSSIYKAEEGQLCPHCKFSILESCTSFSGKTCEFFVYCPNCNAYICTYKPMQHQAAFHLDEHHHRLHQDR